MKHLKINSLNLFYFLYFATISTVITSYLIYVLNSNKNAQPLKFSSLQANYSYALSTTSQTIYKNLQEDISSYDDTTTISQNKIVIPSKDTMLELKEDYNEISSRFSEIQTLKDEISLLYDSVCNSPVCSIANRNFNLLSETYNTYNEKILEIQKYISLYEEKYKYYLDRISQIPKFLTTYQEKYDEFNKLFLEDFELISSKKQNYNEDEEMLYNFYIDAKRIADEFFEEYYDLMCRIVFAEAGNCSAMEQYFVANVIEHRIKDPRFPNTLYDVIYQSGQYAPVINGAINKTPTIETKQYVESYLRGHIETGMPDNVLFQALFKQGKGIWDSGIKTVNIFCYY